MKPRIWHAKDFWWCLIGPGTSFMLWPLTSLGFGKTLSEAFASWQKQQTYADCQVTRL